MIEDRDGKGVEALAQVTDQFLDEAARERRPAARAGPCSRRSRRGCPQLRFDARSRQGPAARRRGLRRLRRPPGQPGRLLRQRLQPLRQGLEGHRPGRGEPPDQARRHHRSLRAQPQEATRSRLSALGDVNYALGPIDVPHYNMYNAAKITGQPAPGTARARRSPPWSEVADRVLPEGFSLRMDRHDVSGAEDRQRGRLHLRPVDRLRVPVHGGALRELDPPAGASS